MKEPNTLNPLIVQSDMSVLLDVMNPMFEEARDALNVFAELQKSPEYMHTYKITPLSLWNAASSGTTYEQAIGILRQYAKHEVPETVVTAIEGYGKRYGKVRLLEEQGEFFLECSDVNVLAEVQAVLKSPNGEHIRVSFLYGLPPYSLSFPKKGN